MYLVDILVVAIIIGLACLLCFWAGAKSAAKSEVRAALRPLRLTSEDAVLYRQAAQILTRLVNLTDISGPISEDLLSSKSRQRIEEWLATYKRELDKV